MEPFFERVSTMDWNKALHVVDYHFEMLLPASLCSQALLERSESALESASPGIGVVRRAWLEANDELARCVRIRGTR